MQLAFSSGATSLTLSAQSFCMMRHDWFLPLSISYWFDHDFRAVRYSPKKGGCPEVPCMSRLYTETLLDIQLIACILWCML